MTPAPSLLAGLRQSLVPHAPFGAMRVEDLDMLVRACSVRYFAAGDIVLHPSPQRAAHCFIVRQGTVRAVPDAMSTDERARTWERGAGEMFPLSSLLENRALTHSYSAVTDTFVLAFPASVFDSLMETSEVFADFCRRRSEHLIDLSRATLQAEFVASVTEQRGPSTPLRELLRQPPLTAPDTMPVGDALIAMDQRRVGSIVAVDPQLRPIGIFTREDVIGRVVLPRLDLASPLASVTSYPVVTLAQDATAGDAALEMTRRGIRHIVLVDPTGRIVGVVSERDLFALQRLSLRELASAIRRSPDMDALVARGADIRALAHSLVAQGIASEKLTRMISSLNDQLLARLIEIVEPSHALGGIRYCWIGMGSEGRNEQTIATDQDNGLIFASDGGPNDGLRERLLPFARAVNEALDRCGYPLCKGGVMAMNPRWCASLEEWQRGFDGWIDRGDPQSLLDASIFFDFRSLFGVAGLAHVLRDGIAARARRTPRFLKQMADNALTRRPALNWFGELDASAEEGPDGIDLKRSGTSLFVDAARILALASGVTETATSDRLTLAGRALEIREDEARSWIAAFDYLQLLRLRTQTRRTTGTLAPSNNPNLVPLADLSVLDRRIVKESMREARRLQQRIELDYPG
ncbi:MAG TPA: DUF294 nucleotidyltransferase-like domain-containing protein [Casimicrobiaceae bacterium]|nr:DUF294 nucleotidyltransferase-like domain-containing protein [Casimicrobiaceae bacterium]